MDLQEVRDNIEEHISKGHADKALKVLMNYTKTTNSPMHEDAILLAGQLRQWKRENMLGVQQSSNELSRIKMGILTVVKSIEEAPEEEIAPVTPPSPDPIVYQASSPVIQQAPVHHPPHSATKSSGNTIAILGAVGGLISLLVVAWLFMGRSKNPQNTANNPKELSETSILTDATQPTAVLPADKNESEPATTLPVAKEETDPPAKEESSSAAPIAKRQTSSSTSTNRPSRIRDVALPNIVATVNCSGRTYKLGDDNRVYDTTGSAKKIGTSTQNIRCLEGILVAKIIPQYGGYLTYYNQAKNDWMETLEEAKQ